MGISARPGFDRNRRVLGPFIQPKEKEQVLMLVKTPLCGWIQ